MNCEEFIENYDSHLFLDEELGEKLSSLEKRVYTTSLL